MSERHPACPGGCGELADECACRRPAPLGAMQVAEYGGDVAAFRQCRWNRCTALAESRGLCEAHLESL